MLRDTINDAPDDANKAVIVKNAMLAIEKEIEKMDTLDKYCWETRIVTRDGMVSFDGVRYVVPWQYNG